MVDSKAVIRCIELVKIYSTVSGEAQALRGVDVTVNHGEVIAIAGPSGSGKSSLLRIIAALDRPTAGRVTVSGVALTESSPRRRRRLRAHLISHVYQRPRDNLIGHLTAVEQLERVAVRRGHSRDEALDMLERVGLADRRYHRPHELSGGEQQRLAFARAATGNPAIVIADEPTAELDSANTELVLDTITSLGQGGTTILIASHDPRALKHIGHVVTLRDGTIASVRRAGEESAVIDHAGRLQLPPDLRRRFPDQRARLDWDDEHDQLTARP